MASRIYADNDIGACIITHAPKQLKPAAVRLPSKALIGSHLGKYADPQHGGYN